MVCQNYANKGVSTSTYGLGQSFNEDLMVGIATSGNGSSYYGETAADLKEPFMEELSLLNAICAKEIKLKPQFNEGIQFSVLNPNIPEKEGVYTLNNLVFESEVWLAFELEIPAELSHSESDAPIDFGSIHLSYQDLDGEEHQLSTKIALPALASSSFEVLSSDAWVLDRLAELEVVRIQTKARRAARRGEWEQVHHLLKKAKLRAGENELLVGIIAELESLAMQQDALLFSKEVSYSNKDMTNSVRSTRLAHEEQRLFMQKKIRKGRRRTS